MMPRRILYVHGVTAIGGAERDLLTIISSLPMDSYKPVVVSPGKGPFSYEVNSRSIETKEARFPPWRKIKAVLQRRKAVRSLREIVEAEQPSVIHVNDIWWVPQVRRAVPSHSVPVITHVRQEIEPPKVWQYELDQVDLVIAVSRQIQAALEAGGIRKDRVQTIYSGLDINRIPCHLDRAAARQRLGLLPESFALGTVANLFPRKGHEVMLEALPMILAEDSTTQYFIIGGNGDRPYERKLRSLAERLSIQKQVHFCGFQDDVCPFLSALDVYVHPALMEGFGIALLEAMAMERPVVATRVGGIPEVVEDGRTGILVSPEDPPALAEACLRLLRHPDQRVRMGEAGKRRVLEQFRLDRSMEALQRVYDAVATHSQ